MVPADEYAELARWRCVEAEPLGGEAHAPPLPAGPSWMASILDALAAHIVVLDNAGKIVAVNRAWRQFASENGGRPQDYEVGVNYLDTVRASVERGDGSAAHALVGIQAVLAGKKAQFDLEYPRPGVAQERWFLMQVSPLPDNGGCVISHINISQRKRQEADLSKAFEELTRTQDQLVQSEKMASIGQLAAGVAHEINNPIGYLHSNLGTLDQYVQDVFRVVEAYEAALANPGDPAAREAIELARKEADFGFLKEDLPHLLAESQEGIQRVRKIVQDLKYFAHAGDSEDWQWVDLRHSLERTLNIVRNELKYKAEVYQDYGDIPEVRCLPGQLNQVFMNLLVNAAHAIDTHGQVSVRTGQAGEEVWVGISDTGCGMVPETIGRIFEPFFTTKPVGQGTGLGLSISYGIVKKHGGRIEVDSQVGRGTTFRIVLPVSGPAEAGTGSDAQTRG